MEATGVAATEAAATREAVRGSFFIRIAAIGVVTTEAANKGGGAATGGKTTAAKSYVSILRISSRRSSSKRSSSHKTSSSCGCSNHERKKGPPYDLMILFIDHSKLLIY